MKKVLLDENLPRPLAKDFSGDLEVISVHDLGWAEKKNGELLRSMLQEGFEYLLTADKNLKNQQNLDKYPIKIVVIRTFDNRHKTLFQYVEIIEQAIVSMDGGIKVIEVDIRENTR